MEEQELGLGALKITDTSASGEGKGKRPEKEAEVIKGKNCEPWSPNSPAAAERETVVGCCHRAQGMDVKIKMDGIPTGRQIDLSAYDSYEKLLSAVDEFFRGLLAAQRDPCGEGYKEGMAILDGGGEYILVYEDNEGDWMLVGDDPWHMFVSTVKRLCVLKTSELHALK